MSDTGWLNRIAAFAIVHRDALLYLAEKAGVPVEAGGDEADDPAVVCLGDQDAGGVGVTVGIDRLALARGPVDAAQHAEPLLDPPVDAHIR